MTQYALGLGSSLAARRLRDAFRALNNQRSQGDKAETYADTLRWLIGLSGNKKIYEFFEGE